MLESLALDVDMSDPEAPPGLLLRLLEGRAPAEAGQLMLQLPLLRLTSIHGRGEPVMVLPGFMADDLSTTILRSFLASIGYSVTGWGQGINRGRMLDQLPPVIERISAMQEKHAEKVRLVGWSRGGILAREIARDCPDLVHKVITVGSPVRGGARVSSIGAWVRRETGFTPDAMANMLRERQRKPINVPVRAIYSKLDGIVAWQACIDDVSPDIEHFEIRGSHMGMGANVEVFRLLPGLLRD